MERVTTPEDMNKKIAFFVVLMKVGAKKTVWIDCDPGHDDAFALILAATHDDIDLIGVSTSAGNQVLQKTTANAVRVLRAIGCKAPVHAGLGKPLMGSDEASCPEIHGESGLDTPPEYAAEASRFVALGSSADAVTWGADTLRAMRDAFVSRPLYSIHLVVTGALTNIATLKQIYPEVCQHVEQLVWLGGAVGDPPGNIFPVAEWNAAVDAHAAQAVLRKGVFQKAVMIGLSVTHKALVTKQVKEKMPAGDGSLERLMRGWVRFFESTYEKVFFMPDPPMHDPLAVAYVIAPELFQVRHLNVEIECCSPLSLGQTVCDIYGVTRREPNVHVALNVDAEKFFELFVEASHKAAKRSHM